MKNHIIKIMGKCIRLSVVGMFFTLLGMPLIADEKGYVLTPEDGIIPGGFYMGTASGETHAYGFYGNVVSAPIVIGNDVRLGAAASRGFEGKSGDGYGIYLKGTNEATIEASNISASSDTGTVYGIYTENVKLNKVKSELTVFTNSGKAFGIYVNSPLGNTVGSIDCDISVHSNSIMSESGCGILLNGVSMGDESISGNIRITGDWKGSYSFIGKNKTAYLSSATGIFVCDSDARKFNAEINIENRSGSATGIHVENSNVQPNNIYISQNINVAGIRNAKGLNIVSNANTADVFLRLSGQVTISAKNLLSGGTAYAVSANTSSGAGLLILGDSSVQTLIGDIYVQGGNHISFFDGNYILDSHASEVRLHFADNIANLTQYVQITVEKNASLQLMKTTNFEGVTKIDGNIALTAKSLSEHASIVLKNLEIYDTHDLILGAEATLSIILLNDFTAEANDSLRVITNTGTKDIGGDFSKVVVKFEDGTLLSEDLYDFDVTTGLLTFTGTIVPEATNCAVILGMSSFLFVCLHRKRCAL